MITLQVATQWKISKKKTYAYCLKPVEGMQNWPVSEMAKSLPLKTLMMPGRPKKERRREPHEKPKRNILPKRGTVIRCRKCKQTEHNRSTCEKRNSGTSSRSQSTAQSQNAMVQYHNKLSQVLGRGRHFRLVLLLLQRNTRLVPLV